jgi:type I restriction enzyme S subunit
MRLETFFEKFDQFADAPDAAEKLRELVLELALQGRLTSQEPTDLSAIECIRRANRPLCPVELDEAMEVPPGWAALPLGCLIALNTGGGTPSKQNPEYWNGPIPWASVKDVKSEKYLASTIDSITEAGLRNSSSNLIPANRLIVVTRMGLGKLAINAVPLAINQDLRAIEPTNALDLDFGYLLFKGLKLVGTGVTVKGVTVDKLHAMPVLMPPLAEQKRIVAKVDELLGLCDRLEEQHQERQMRHTALARALLARLADAPTSVDLDLLFHHAYTIAPTDLRKSILTLAFQGDLTQSDDSSRTKDGATSVLSTASAARRRFWDDRHGAKRKYPEPEDHESETLPRTRNHWLWASIDSICAQVTDGEHIQPPYQAEGVPMLSAKHVRDGYVTLDGAGLISEEAFQKAIERCQPEDGDILIVSVGATTGRSAIVDDCPRFAIVRSVLLLKPVIMKEYLLWWLKNPWAFAWMTKASGASAQPHLYIRDLKHMPVPIAPLCEQRQIVAKVDQLMALVDLLETQLVAARVTAANLLEALVDELTSQAWPLPNPSQDLTQGRAVL